MSYFIYFFYELLENLVNYKKIKMKIEEIKPVFKINYLTFFLFKFC